MGLQFDPSFIQEQPHRPKPTIIEAENIPLIDLSSILNSGDDIPDSLIKEIGKACEEWGFFQVINHGVPAEILEKLQGLIKEFFDLPMEEKVRVRRDEDNPLGYYEGENTKNVRDWKEIFDFMVNEPVLIPVTAEPGETRKYEIRNQWPEFPPQFREVCQEYQEALEKLQHKLLELIALSLGLPASRLNDFFKDETTSFIRINHYPPCPNPELALGVGRHKDSGVITILAQDDVGGLEVRRKADDEWVRVKPTPNAYIINIGDIVQVWSNDKYESADHRVVVNSKRERFSIPYFVMPSCDLVIKPLEELVTEENPSNYLGYNWGEFFKKRKISDYKKLAVENVQIHHFTKSDACRTVVNEGDVGIEVA